MKKGKKLLVFTTSMLATVLMPVLGVEVGGHVGLLGNGAIKNASYSANGKFYTDYDSFDEAKKAAEDLNLRMSEEGNSLLKNIENSLPMSEGARLSVFGVKSDNVEGGGDDGVADSLEHAGFIVNPTLKSFYANNTNDIGNEEYSFNGSIKSSFSLYDDGAVFIISRTGGEGADLSVNTNETVGDDDTHKDLATKDGKKYKHYLMLTNSEEALLKVIEANFDKVHIIINSSHIIEAGELEDDENIKSILWIGRPGETGLDAVGKIYKGEVNPSGGVVDQWARDFTSDPTWQNFGDNSQHDVEYGNVFRYPDGKRSGSNTAPNTFPPLVPGWHGVDYEEGIYLGYKYYETYYSDLAANKGAEAAETWYKNNVAYPFGFGLNYTSFSFNASGVFTDAALTKELASDVSHSLFESSVGHEAEVKKLYIPVTVKNTGNVAGKKSVQVYVSAPYNSEALIEKSSVTLAGFGKTEILAPGEEEVVVVEINVQDFASYDAKDANGNGNKGYELDKGEYTIRVMENAHFDVSTDVDDTADAYWEKKFTLDEATNLKLDDFSGLEVTNLFSKENGLYYSERVGLNVKDTADMTIMSRSDFDGTFPKSPTLDDLTLKQDFFDTTVEWEKFDADDTTTYGSWDDKSDEKAAEHPWSKDVNVPDTWTQNSENHGKIKLFEMAGIDPKGTTAITSSNSLINGKTGAEAWEIFMNSLTWDELKSVPQNGGWSTGAVESIGLESSVDNDSPEDWCSTHLWCDSPTISATFNTELAEEEGIIVANLGLLKEGANLTGWYGPGMDTHRSPFSGRNNQYYSQDGLHAGYFAAAVVRGAESRGVITYSKHFALNDQESARDGELNASFCTEQAIREIYAKPFQMAYQEGGASASMTSFARIGRVPAPSNYNFLTEMVRNQWGWDGYFVTDGYEGVKKNSSLDMMMRSGNDLALENIDQEGTVNVLVHFNEDDETKSETVVREVPISGEWDATKRNNKGNVVLGDSKTESLAQYFFVRRSTQRMLHKFANSVKVKNGIDMSQYAGTEIALTQGTKLSDVSVKASTSVIGDASMSYTLTSGTLPQGVTLNYDGTLTGTPLESGEFEFTVSAKAENWITGSATFKLNVASVFSTAEGFEKAEVGTAYVGYIDSDVVTTGTYTKGVEFALYSGSLPDGLTLDSEGKISGTPTKAGTYEFTIEVTASRAAASSGPFSRTETNKFLTTHTITVTEKAVTPDEPDTPVTPDEPDTPVTPDTNTEVKVDNTVGIVGLVFGIIGAVLGAAALVLNVFKKKRQ